MDGIDPASNGHRVLVVDDEPQVVWVLELALGSEGYEVCTARNGVEAMAQISAKHPELMVLDVMMPRMDGWSRRSRSVRSPRSSPRRRAVRGTPPTRMRGRDLRRRRSASRAR